MQSFDDKYKLWGRGGGVVKAIIGKLHRRLHRGIHEMFSLGVFMLVHCYFAGPILNQH